MERSLEGMKKEIEKFFEDGSLGLAVKSVTKATLWLEVHCNVENNKSEMRTREIPHKASASFQLTVTARSAPIHVAPPKNNESAWISSLVASLWLREQWEKPFPAVINADTSISDFDFLFELGIRASALTARLTCGGKNKIGNTARACSDVWFSRRLKSSRSERREKPWMENAPS